jgi:acyl carrier protein
MIHNGSDIEAQVVQTLTGKLPAGVRVSGDTRIIEGLGLDSVAILDLIMDLEDRFDISIPLDRIAEVQTVGELSRAIVTLMGTPR